MFLGYIAPRAHGTAGHLSNFTEAPLGFLFIYAMLAGMFFSFLVCAKTAVWPSLIFAADADGVILGKGVFWNTTRRLPWSAVESLSPGKVRIRNRNHSYTQPALRIEFHQDHGMGNTGLKFGHPVKSTAFVVAESVMGRSVDNAIDTLEQLRKDAQSSSR